MNRRLLTERLDATENHLVEQALRGYDPYDALCSPAFRLPLLRSNHYVRFGAQQVVKRLPFNVRPLLRVPKQLNPVSVALYLQGLAHRTQAEDSQDRSAEAARCVALLAELASPGWTHPCWGYPFDWETRYGPIPANTPTIVATGIVTNALAVADDVFDFARARELILGAASFVLQDLNRVDGPHGTFCWSYSPHDRQAVLNATLKGSRLLAQANARGASADVLEPAAQSARFVMSHQQDSGAWPYSIGDARTWPTTSIPGTSSSASRVSAAERRRSCGGHAEKGWRYYRDRFFAGDMTRSTTTIGRAPSTTTACAQAAITLCAFDDIEAAAKASARTASLLGRADGCLLPAPRTLRRSHPVSQVVNGVDVLRHGARVRRHWGEFVLAWIDIDNPPQVQYMVPFVEAFERRGLDVLVTARDYGFTTELLRARGVSHHVIGDEFGRSRAAKVGGTLRRAARLATGVARRARPSLLLSTSRSAALASRTLRVPSFMVLDYEYAELASFRLAGTTVVYPDVIDARVFHEKGFEPRSLLTVRGDQRGHQLRGPGP